MKWEIWYDDNSVVVGETEQEWKDAPDVGVQVVVLHEPYAAPHLSPWTGVWDRKLWTGTDDFDPFGWGNKIGTLMTDEAYLEIWRKACGH